MANPSEMSSDYAIGIDLGTTYSCVAVFRHGRVQIIDNDSGQRTTPSYVAFTGDERLVGEAAKSHASNDPANTVYEVKRLIGRRFDDEMVKHDAKRWPFKVIEAEGGTPMIEVTYKGQVKKCKPEEISSMVLGKMRQIAEDFLEQPVTKAVITVPAYFNDSQRNATIDAGKIAGLEVLRIINEPTAAGYCYGMDKLNKGNRNVLIFDLGGGTFDVTILNIDKEMFTVKSTAGDSHLGGQDFDNLLVDYCILKLKEKHGAGINIDKCAVQIIRFKCETAKITLSSACQTVINLDCLFASLKFSLTITRALFEQLCDRLFRSTLDTVSRVFADSKISKAQIDDIVLVGGSTRIPRVQQLLQEFFDGRELRRSVNPDLAVAYGAAIQAAILNVGECRQAIQNLQLCDVTPLSLGIEEGFNGAMDIVVKRNTPIPTKKQQKYVTRTDDQTSVWFKVFEGERPLVKDNHFLGKFTVDGIPPAPRGVEKFTCTFDIDENGILSVSAVNHSTGKHREITISNSGQMPKQEIKRLIKEAELMRKDDEDVRLRIAAKDKLERLVYKVKRNISGTGTDNSNKIKFKILEQLRKAQKLLDRDEIGAKELYDNRRIKLQRLSNLEL